MSETDLRARASSEDSVQPAHSCSRIIHLFMQTTMTGQTDWMYLKLLIRQKKRHFRYILKTVDVLNHILVKVLTWNVYL